MEVPTRSASRPRPTSRPTTPLRASSRSSLREAHGGYSIGNARNSQPAINALEPQFAELADSMADLEANFMHLQLMHESLTRFSESFASFLYGMNMNAFCVDFPEAPIPDSFRRAQQAEEQKEAEIEPTRPDDGEMTFLTTDTTFVEHPPSTVSKPSRYATRGGTTRGTRVPASNRYTTRGASSSRTRPSALPRGRGTGTGTR
ncbi:DASH complex subunit dam1 [Penicillium taxi]|uniref:DASH complex subunit dam1 n=1 Tax=Penicillium taxi TaxID=168475 RepID=UPI0025453930|nr:DASH complex subunit dam1 [Penicillium taxi]KAJ5898779.1 DASH complex subunit dam1 [Penicillium taxi]